MGTSHPETKPWVVEKIIESGARSVLDVGAGAGNWVDALRDAGFAGIVDAVEVWKPYVEQYRLRERYQSVYTFDIRVAPPMWFGFYDVVIFGDVLEHMSKSEAMDLWRRAIMATNAVIAIPIIHYCQGALNGNPYEVHVKDDWTHTEVLASFPGITEWETYTVTGAYWRGPQTSEVTS